MRAYGDQPVLVSMPSIVLLKCRKYRYATGGNAPNTGLNITVADGKYATVGNASDARADLTTDFNERQCFGTVNKVLGHEVSTIPKSICRASRYFARRTLWCVVWSLWNCHQRGRPSCEAARPRVGDGGTQAARPRARRRPTRTRRRRRARACGPRTWRSCRRWPRRSWRRWARAAATRTPRRPCCCAARCACAACAPASPRGCLRVRPRPRRVHRLVCDLNQTLTQPVTAAWGPAARAHARARRPAL